MTREITFMQTAGYAPAKTKFRKLISALKKAGFQVPPRQDCKTCTWELVDGNFYKAAVYSDQDWWTFQRSGKLYLGYGWQTPVGSKSQEAGKEICKLAQEIGLITNWDGDPSKRIQLIFEA